MTYDEYLLMTAQTEIDLPTYKAMLKDAISSQSRLEAIMNVLCAINVPERSAGDVDEIWREGIEDIKSGDHADDMMIYAPMIWAMTPSLAESLYNVLDQMFEV
jgi:hypothetical protein